MPDARSSRELQIVDTVLTNIARQYRPTGFIADVVAPRIGVEEDSGRYPTFSIQSFFGDDSDSGDQTKVADRAPTPEISFDWSTDTYYCEDYRLKVSITAKERRQGHEALRLETSKLNALLDRMAIRREVRIANALRQTGDGGQLTAGSATPTNWDQDTATIETDIMTGALAVRGKIGRLTNAIAADLKVFYNVALQADIREIVKYTVPGDRILLEGGGILPNMLHRHKVIVAEGMRNTAKKDATASLSPIWSDEVRLVYLPADGGGWGIPSVAYQFEAKGQEVDRWQEADPPVEFIRAWEDQDEKVCGPDAGYSLKAVLS